MPVGNSVTVLGAAGSTVTVALSTSQNLALAQLLASSITQGVNTGSVVDPAANTAPGVPLGKIGEFTKTASGLTTLHAPYDDVVNTSANAIIFGSGDANEEILSGLGGLTFYTTSGSGTLVSGSANNSIYIAATDAGSWTIATDDGANHIVDLGTGGADSISAGAGRNTIQLGAGQYQVNTTGSDTILAGRGAETIGATGGGNDIVAGGGSSVFFINGLAASTVLGGTGSDTIFAGNGGGYYVGGTGGNNLLQGGDGAATLFGGGNGDYLQAGAAGQVLHAGAGNETLTAGITTGTDTLFGGSGAATMSASPLGSDIFAFAAGSGGGTDVVNGFVSGVAKVALVGVTVSSQISGGGNDLVTLSDGTKVTFTGVTNLSPSDFV